VYVFGRFLLLLQIRQSKGANKWRKVHNVKKNFWEGSETRSKNGLKYAADHRRNNKQGKYGPNADREKL